MVLSINFLKLSKIIVKQYIRNMASATKLTTSELNNTCYTKYDQTRLKCIDIGANLTDHMYNGIYNHGNHPIHPNDLENVLQRSFANHVDKIIITGGSLHDAKESIKLAARSDKLYATVGCHPTRSNEFEQKGQPDKYLDLLHRLILENSDKVVAVGECGLDYDRLHFSPKEIQKIYFEKQLELPKLTKKPLFLHCRNAYDDFFDIMKRHHDQLHGGVVHSFTGSIEDAKRITDLGYFIGINGCSLKTQENIDAMCSIPTELLMIETDAPWCEVKPTHAGFKYVKTRIPCIKKEKWDASLPVKSRNEPATIIQVLEIMAAARNEDMYELAATMYENSKKLFKI